MDDCCKDKGNGKKIISGIIFITLIAIAYFSFTGGRDSSGLPAYAFKDKNVKGAYLFATENPGALDGVNCHCGCMNSIHNGRIHSRGLLDCFRNGDGYDAHGAQCGMCVYDALEVKKLTSEGKTKEEIKSIIDEKRAVN